MAANLSTAVSALIASHKHVQLSVGSILNFPEPTRVAIETRVTAGLWLSNRSEEKKELG